MKPESNKRIKVGSKPLSQKWTPVYKDDQSGNKRRYLTGIASGTDIDGHGTYMNDECIDSFNEQAKEKNVLLYTDEHGIKSITDVGILTKSEVTKNIEWAVEFRLYDELDELVDTISKEAANKLWAQVNGLPPYNFPEEKGFSIEGDGVVKRDTMGVKYYNHIKLDGVVIVPEPAYQNSKAVPVMKSKVKKEEGQTGKLSKLMTSLVIDKAKSEQKNEYFDARWKLQDALEVETKKIMQNPEIADKGIALNEIAAEFAALYSELALSHPLVFMKEPDEDTVIRSAQKKEKVEKKAAIDDKVKKSLDAKNKQHTKELQVKKLAKRNLAAAQMKSLAAEIEKIAKSL